MKFLPGDIVDVTDTGNGKIYSAKVVREFDEGGRNYYLELKWPDSVWINEQDYVKGDLLPSGRASKMKLRALAFSGCGGDSS